MTKSIIELPQPIADCPAPILANPVLNAVRWLKTNTIMEKIISISEAFSMQPKFLKVSNESDWEFINDKPNAVKEIKLQDLGNYPDKEMYYVGYNFEGKKIFQYIANTVNVHYEAV